MSPPWRLVVFVLASVVGVLGLRVVQGIVSASLPVGARPASFVTVMAGGLLIGHLWTLRQVEPRGWAWVGLGRAALTPEALGTGIALGALAIALPVAALLGMGWAAFEPGEPGSLLPAAVGALALLIPAALWEELFVRGFAFSLLLERWGEAVTLAVTSLAFGAMHLLNAEATVMSCTVVTLAGIFLGLVRLRTGSLYAAWAAHVAWNAALVIGFHAAVSGLALPAPGWRFVETGPDLATGGAWGPEGGLFAAGGLIVAAWIINRRPGGRVEQGHE